MMLYCYMLQYVWVVLSFSRKKENIRTEQITLHKPDWLLGQKCNKNNSSSLGKFISVDFQAGVNEGAVHLNELNILLSHRYALFKSNFMVEENIENWNLQKEHISSSLKTCIYEQLRWILGGASSVRKSREDSAIKRALGEPLSGIYGCLIRHG